MDSSKSEVSNQCAQEWLDTVADSTNTMSQRRLSSIETRGGGLEAVKALAEQKGVHLLRLEDDKGNELIADKRLRHGFTLVELLAVLGVVSLLTAILLPVFVRVREKARQAACASSLRQLSLALSAYSIDYDERYPTTAQSAADTTNIAWAGQVYPHVRNAGVFRCPTDSTDDTVRPVVSYGLNLDLAAAPSLASLTAPAHTVLLFEVSGDHALLTDSAEGQTTGGGQPQVSATGDGLNGSLLNLTGQGAGRPDSAQYATGLLDNSEPLAPLPPDLNQYQNPARHSGGANFLLADDHVTWVEGSQVSAGGNATSAANSQSRFGCQYRGLGPGGAPCAEGTANGQHFLTFSAN